MNEIWVKLKVANIINKNNDMFTEESLRKAALKNPTKLRYNEWTKQLEGLIKTNYPFPLTGNTIIIEQSSLSDEQV